MDAAKKENQQISSQDLLSHLQQALIVADKDGTIIQIEGAFDVIFHQSAKSLIGHPLSELGLEAETTTVLRRLNEGQSSVVIHDISVADRFKQIDQMDIMGIPFGHQGLFMLTFSPKKRVSQVSDHHSDMSGALLTVNGLSAMLAHEIKNPLSGIRGAAQLLARKIDDDQQRLTDMMVNEVDRISRLVSDLERFANPDFDMSGQVNVHEALDQAIENIGAGIGCDIEFKRLYDPSLPMIKGSFDPLVQVFLNVIKNAAEASPSRGVIRIYTHYQHSLWLRNENGDRTKVPIEVVIADQGTGIDPSIKDHLFDPFVTNKEGGSGMGLAIVARNMTAMGGIVKCDTNASEGTQMHLFFQQS